MALYTSLGSTTAELTDRQIEDALCEAFHAIGPKQNVVVVPPDYTRKASRAGDLTGMAYRYYGGGLKDVIPAVGTHDPMTDAEWESMFPDTPHSLMRYHNWRTDVETIGEVPAEFVADATGGVYRQPWPAQLNRNLWQGSYDLILSIGQVVPHELKSSGHTSQTQRARSPH
ncbi:MAG: D-mannonate epimerase, partial [Planctomycetota bacterium]